MSSPRRPAPLPPALNPAENSSRSPRCRELIYNPDIKAPDKIWQPGAGVAYIRREDLSGSARAAALAGAGSTRLSIAWGIRTPRRRPLPRSALCSGAGGSDPAPVSLRPCQALGEGPAPPGSHRAPESVPPEKGLQGPRAAPSSAPRGQCHGRSAGLPRQAAPIPNPIPSPSPSLSSSSTLPHSDSHLHPYPHPISTFIRALDPVPILKSPIPIPILIPIPSLPHPHPISTFIPALNPVPVPIFNSIPVAVPAPSPSSSQSHPHS